MTRSKYVLATITMMACAIIVVSSAYTLITSVNHPKYHEWDVAEAYSCAFINGQHDIMNSMPDLFPIKYEEISFCAKFRELAARYGFREGKP